MYVVPEHLRPEVNDQFCDHVISSEAVCFGYPGEERGRAVN